MPRVSKSLDFLDRVGWTIIVAVLSALLTVVTSNDIGWQEAVKFVVIAAIGTALKVLAGQNTGTDDTGALIGKPVIEPPPVAEEKP